MRSMGGGDATRRPSVDRPTRRGRGGPLPRASEQTFPAGRWWAHRQVQHFGLGGHASLEGYPDALRSLAIPTIIAKVGEAGDHTAASGRAPPV
jgi:hypothetical protein